MMEQTYWRKCSICKKEIPFHGVYFNCSVSTCHKNIYCSVTCWDVHVPVMNHKNAWAEEEEAPSLAEFFQTTASTNLNEREPRKMLAPRAAPTLHTKSQIPKEILVVASKLKQYVKSKHDLNTAANVLDALSDIIRFECDKAAEKARGEGRKTLMDRDF